MSGQWQRVRLPFVERAVLLELAERWCVDEAEALRRILREAAVRELTHPGGEVSQQVQETRHV